MEEISKDIQDIRFGWRGRVLTGGELCTKYADGEEEEEAGKDNDQMVGQYEACFREKRPLGMKCVTELHGGDCHHTLTAHRHS